MENPGIDPGTSRMQSGRSTIWANSPILSKGINKTKLNYNTIYFQRGTFEAHIIFAKLFHSMVTFLSKKEVFGLAYALINQQN